MATIKTKTQLKVVIPKGSNLTMPLVFQQDSAHHVWVDWGDGSYPDTYTYQGRVEAKHTYPSSGEYNISMQVVDDGWLILGGGWTGGNFVGGSDEAFARMLVSVYIGDDVTGIADYAFRGCENLESITIPKNREMTIGAFAFDGCGSIETIAIPNNISIIPRGCFMNCASLKKVDVHNGIYEIEPYAFYGCSNLREYNLRGVTKIDKGAFGSCRKLKEVLLGEKCFYVEEGAFSGCSCIEKLVLGSVKTIGDQAFYGDKALQTLEIPENLETIGAMAFLGCTSLKTIKMAASTPPVLMAANSIEPNEDMKIIVPGRSKWTYANATNWCVLESAIEEG